jgi:hypothetical protein
MSALQPLKRITYDNGYTVSVVEGVFGGLECAVITPGGHVREPTLHNCWDEVKEIQKEVSRYSVISPEEDRRSR